MKKLTFIAAMALAAGLASCSAQGPKANLKSEIDSLSYYFGMGQTQGIEQFFAQNSIDSTNMVEFLKGFNEGAASVVKVSDAKLAGIQLGQMVSKRWVDGLNKELFGDDATESINREQLLAGFIQGMLHPENTEEITKASAYARTQMDIIKEKAVAEKYADNKAAGEKFLAENKDKEGVVTTASGLQYKVITEGKGAIPEKTDKVKVNYRGTLIDGTEFDSSYKRKDKDGNAKPAEFRANQVIKGWTEALTMMPVGSKWELYIPQDLAYGSRNTGGDIKPFSTLIFEVELVEIVKDEKKK